MITSENQVRQIRYGKHGHCHTRDLKLVAIDQVILDQRSGHFGHLAMARKIDMSSPKII